MGGMPTVKIVNHPMSYGTQALNAKLTAGCCATIHCTRRHKPIVLGCGFSPCQTASWARALQGLLHWLANGACLAALAVPQNETGAAFGAWLGNFEVQCRHTGCFGQDMWVDLAQVV